MNNNISDVLQEFLNFSAVPRRSDHYFKAIEYVCDWAQKHGLEYIFDDVNDNVIIRKAASKGKEDRPGVVLQGHLDMVAQKDPDIDHDFDKEGINILFDGDFIHAQGTTLGADDGSAVAIALAILADDSIANPPLEALFTTNEEVGMDSVKNADLSILNGKYLINIDNGEEGLFTIGCCGGHTIRSSVSNIRSKAEGTAVKISISGLKGGHSGIEIGSLRANALKILGEVLYNIEKECSFRISYIDAEGRDNVISKYADCVIIADPDSIDKIADLVDRCSTEYKKKYRITDPDINISLSGLSAADALSEQSSRALTFLLHQLPYGVLYREQGSNDAVETSANLGFIDEDDSSIGIVASIRSSVPERIDEILGRIRQLCSVVAADCADDGKDYPPWIADYNSPLIDLFSNVYMDMYNKKPVVAPVHAGLECGYILRNSNLEAAISIGPDIYGEHTSEEKMSVSSLNRVYDFVKKVLETV